MQNLILRVCGNRETIEIAANSNYEIVFNEIDNALRKLYEISNHRRRYGNKCLCFRASVGENELLFGIGLSADDSGKIIWECKYGFDRIARGTTKYSRYVDGAFWYMASMIINHFGLTDLQTLNEAEEQAKYEEQMDTMFEYAQDAHEDIEGYVEDAIERIEDIERTLADPDYSILEDTIAVLWERLEDIHNAFSECLHRCDYLTGCDITFDDFCGSDYFSDIHIPGYMGWGLEDLMYNGDPADVLENILGNINRQNPGNTDTLTSAIEGTGLHLAA